MAIKKFTFAGHSAVFFETQEILIAIDPWLEGNPLCPDNLKQPKKLDLIVLTHGHPDHAGSAAALARKYGSTIAATWELAMIMGREGVPDGHIIPMNKGGTIEYKGLRITLTHALHSSSYDSATGPEYAGEACGVIIDDGHFPVYHAGDTSLFSDMALIKEWHKPHFAFLPIGDRFTMGPKEAARAASLIGCKLAIPIHYKTFPLLTGTAEEFKQECAKYSIETLALDPGESYSIE